MKFYKGKKIVILGGGFDQYDLIIEAQRLGLEVICIDKNPNCFGKKYANEFYNFSITDKKRIIEIIKKNKISGIMSICSDRAVPIISDIAKKFNFASISKKNAKIFTDKILMKKMFNKKKILTSKHFVIKKLKEVDKVKKKLNFPMVIKPHDSFGQKGIFKINNLNNLKNKIKKSISFSSKKKVIIESFVEGDEVNIVVVVIKGKHFFLSFSNRVTFKKKGFGVAYEHSSPIRQSKKFFNNLSKSIKKIIEYTKIKNAILYPQIIIDKNNNAYFLEIAARVPGGCMREVSLLVSGVDIIKCQIDMSLKKKISNIKKIQKDIGVYVKFLTKADKINIKDIDLKKIDKLKKKKNIYKIKLNKLNRTPKLENSSSRFAAVVAYGKNLLEAKSYANKVIKDLGRE